jgi:hypothetical protein
MTDSPDPRTDMDESRLAMALYRLLGAVDDCPEPDAITVAAIRHGWEVLADAYPSFRHKTSPDPREREEPRP